MMRRSGEGEDEARTVEETVQQQIDAGWEAHSSFHDMKHCGSLSCSRNSLDTTNSGSD